MGDGKPNIFLEAYLKLQSRLNAKANGVHKREALANREKD